MTIKRKTLARILQKEIYRQKYKVRRERIDFQELARVARAAVLDKPLKATRTTGNVIPFRRMKKA